MNRLCLALILLGACDDAASDPNDAGAEASTQDARGDGPGEGGDAAADGPAMSEDAAPEDAARDAARDAAADAQDALPDQRVDGAEVQPDAEADASAASDQGVDAEPAPDGGVDEASALIGPEGGTIELGEITVRVPADAVDAPVEVTLRAVELPPGIFLQSGFEAVGPSFVVEPPIAPIAVEVEVGDATARLVSAAAGVLDGPRGAMRGLMEVGREPAGREAGVTRFDLGRSQGAWRVVARGLPEVEVVENGQRLIQRNEARSVPVANSCEAALAAAGLEPIEGLDAQVVLIADPLSMHASFRVDCGLQDASIAEDIERFVGRVCLAAAQTLAHYEGPMQLPVGGPLLVTLGWSKRVEVAEPGECEHPPAASPPGTPRAQLPSEAGLPQGPAGDYGECEGLAPSALLPACAATLATANGMGLDVYFNPTCLEPYAGCLAPEGDPACDPIEWQSSGFNSAAAPDELEHIVAHEIFHWVHDNVDGEPFNFGGPWIFTEGGAEAAAEQVFDGVLSEPSPARIWQTPSWSRCGLHPYRMHAFWRWLEASSGQRPLALFMALLADSVPPLTVGEGWAAMDLLFADLNDSDRVGALADFAAEWLLRHDFEREDPSPDALGLSLSEEVAGELWGPWDEGFEPALDAPVPMATEVIEVMALPHANEEVLAPYTARLYELGVEGQPALRLRVSGQAQERVEHVGVRLLRKVGEAPSTEVWSLDRISTAAAEEAWSSTVLAPTPGARWWLVVANPLHHPLDLSLRIEEEPERLVAMTAQGVQLLNATGGLALEGELIAAPSDARGVLGVGGGRAVLARRDGTVALVELEGLAEVDLDGDPMSTTRGAPEGVTRFDLGEQSRPEGAAVTADGRFAFIALRGAEEVAVLDLQQRRVCKRVDVGAVEAQEAPSTLLLSPDGAHAWLAVPGMLNDPFQEVARLSPAALTACDDAGGEVVARYLTGARRAGPLALSGDGQLAVGARATAQVRVLDGLTGAPTNIAWRGDPYFDAGQIPTALAWAPGDQRLFIGNLFGVEDTPLAGHGTVNVGERMTGRDSYHVGVQGSVTGLVVSEDGQRVFVGDDLGNITELSVDLWDGSAEHVRAPFNRSGGCWNERGSSPIACPASHTLAAPIEGLVRAR